VGSSFFTLRALGAVALGSVLVTSCDEIRDAHYPTLAEAIADKKIKQGWIPTGIPNDARDIRLRYDIENIATWLAFTTDSAASLDSLAGSRLEPNAARDIHYADFSDAEWWPRALTRGGRGDLAKSALRFYRVIEPAGSPAGSPNSLYVAVDAEHSRVYMWRPPA
jgi:hypothetical protein